MDLRSFPKLQVALTPGQPKSPAYGEICEYIASCCQAVRDVEYRRFSLHRARLHALGGELWNVLSNENEKQKVCEKLVEDKCFA